MKLYLDKLNFKIYYLNFRKQDNITVAILKE